MYDIMVFGFEWYVFLFKWFCMVSSYVCVVIDSEGFIVGYMVVWLMFIKESYKIGLLFVDLEVIVEKLLKVVFEELFWEEVFFFVVCIDVFIEKVMKFCERF